MKPTTSFPEKEKKHVFQHPILEAFTRSSPAITFTFYPLVVLVLVFISERNYSFPLQQSILLFAGGLFFWTLFEYWMHRYVFHFLNENKMVQRFHYMVHGIHHENPLDEERVFMPPLPGTLIILLLTGILFLILGKYAFIFEGGMLLGYTFYALIHYNVHLKKPVKGFRYLWKHHALHHYKYPDKAYGVSSPLWDMVFGSMPPKNTGKETAA